MGRERRRGWEEKELENREEGGGRGGGRGEGKVVGFVQGRREETEKGGGGKRRG